MKRLLYTAQCILKTKLFKQHGVFKRMKYAARENFKENATKNGTKFGLQGEILYGIHPIQLALSAKQRKFYKLYIKQTPDNSTGNHPYVNLSLAAKGLVEIQTVTRQVLDKLSNSRPHQGVCLQASPLTVPDLDFSKHAKLLCKDTSNTFPIWLLPYRVKDPMNLGAVLRSAYYLGVDHVVLPSIHTCPMSPVVSKASAGAMELINISLVKTDDELRTFLQKWKEYGGQIVGSSASPNSKSINNFKIRSPILLIVGNEEKGIEDSISEFCDVNISIHPASSIHPLMDSLNVSVATGILLHYLTSSNKS